MTNFRPIFKKTWEPDFFALICHRNPSDVVKSPPKYPNSRKNPENGGAGLTIKTAESEYFAVFTHNLRPQFS